MSIWVTPVDPDKSRLQGFYEDDEKDDFIFQRTNTCWSVLWHYIAKYCDFLSERQRHYGAVNEHVLIESSEAIRISEVLQLLLVSGKVRQYAQSYAAWVRENRPGRQCPSCNGTGKGTEPLALPDGSCPPCRGTGTQAAPGYERIFCEDDVVEFSEFARYSGGFHIV